LSLLKTPNTEVADDPFEAVPQEVVVVEDG
jgi:hypothetical protein